MKQKKKVCVLLPEHYSSNMGGAEYQAKLLVEALVRTGNYDLTYLCNQSKEQGVVPDGYRIVSVGKNLNSLKGLLSCGIAVYKHLCAIAPDIVYQNVGGLFTGVAAHYAKKHKKRLIWHIASDDDITPQWKSNVVRELRLAPERFFLKYGLKNSDIIAAQTNYQATLLKRHHGIDTSHFIPIGHPVPTNSQQKFKKITVLWIANLKPLKRPETFVRLASYFSGMDNVSFKMIGHTGWGRWFDTLIHDIDGMSNIEYLGRLPQKEVNDYLGKSHLLVNTSIYEGFSNTFVQAWLRKVPVVSLSVDPDSILANEKIGCLSSTFDRLCSDVNSLIEDTALREDMGHRAFSYAANHHSVSNMVDHALGLFELCESSFSREETERVFLTE